MVRLLAFALAVTLAGCVVSPATIKTDSLSFDDVIEDTTNKLLVMNILRARDNAPLHFADIPVIRQSMQQTASLGIFNFLGPLANTTQRDSMALGTSAQKSPSFEVTHLGSKEFNIGMASPIDAKFVKYWLDRGLDRRIVLLMFFSAAEIIETASPSGPVNTIRVMNSPRQAIDVIRARKAQLSEAEQLRCDGQSDFERYLKLLNKLSTFFAHAYRERRLLATGMNLDIEKDARGLQGYAALDQTKVQLVLDQERRTYSLYALSNEPKVAFCFYEGNQSAEFISAGAAAPSSKRSCFQPVVDVPPEDSTKRGIVETPVFFRGPAAVKEPSRHCEIYNAFTAPATGMKSDEYPTREVRLHIRSVGEIFQFLGDLLQYQDEVKQHLDRNRPLHLKLNTPVTFGYCGDDPVPGCDDIFIRLDGDACNARFSLTYRDRRYSVANFSPPHDARDGCTTDSASPRDHTLEILSVLHQLVGVHKSATDLRATPFVQVLP